MNFYVSELMSIACLGRIFLNFKEIHKWCLILSWWRTYWPSWKMRNQRFQTLFWCLDVLDIQSSRFDSGPTVPGQLSLPQSICLFRYMRYKNVLPFAVTIIHNRILLNKIKTRATCRNANIHFGPDCKRGHMLTSWSQGNSCARQRFQGSSTFERKIFWK